MSASYPFLSIARNNNCDYGLVLSYADMTKKYLKQYHVPGYWLYNSRERASNVWQQQARDQLDGETKRQIIEQVVKLS